jgi:heme peroxidase
VPLGQGSESGRDPPGAGFGYMFGPTKRQIDDPAIDALAELMEGRKDKSTENTWTPAGYTYLGQFVDHDITFDASSHRKPAGNPRALVNFRTPRLDLDSLYGSGPVVHPFLYDWEHTTSPGARLLVGHNAKGGNDDLPRNLPGRALIGDARNEENVITAQIHLLFIQFHNAVLDGLAGAPKHWQDRFEDAREIVRWHYQWLVVHDFLPKILGDSQTSISAGSGGVPRFRRWRPPDRGEPFIPVEFSAGAFRFGHTMVRREYALQRRTGPQEVPPKPLFPDLGRLAPLPPDLVIDWERFFKFDQLGYAREPQNSLQMDTALVSPLLNLPDSGGSLARRNLRRAQMLQVPSGQEVAKRLKLKSLDPEELMLDELSGPVREKLLEATPLWYYVLCEARRTGGDHGKHLGPVGGRIVSEVILGLLASDPTSYVQQPGWKPDLVRGGDFKMTDLIEFAMGPIV